MNVTKQPTELEVFAGKRYQIMQRRFRARYTRDGRCYRPAIPLPFSLRQFTEWLYGVFREGVTRCYYCEWPISLETTRLDHRVPIVHGGSLELWNLVPVCEPCNQLKGTLSEDGFLQLKILLARINEQDAADIRGRLQSQLKLALWKQAKVRAESVRIVPHRREAV